eukprot:755961-Hanusia_phi.AAC.3
MTMLLVTVEMLREEKLATPFTDVLVTCSQIPVSRSAQTCRKLLAPVTLGMVAAKDKLAGGPTRMAKETEEAGWSWGQEEKARMKVPTCSTARSVKANSSEPKTRRCPCRMG